MSIPTADLKAKAPKRNQPLEPLGSIVHWPEIYNVLSPSRWFVPVTCGWCEQRHQVKILNKSGHLTTDVLRDSRNGTEYTGLCPLCAVRLKGPDRLYPDGSKLFLYEYDKSCQGLPYICGKCEERQFFKCSKDEVLGGFTATYACESCAHIVGDVRHENGALIHWARRVRTGENWGQVPFDCRRCGREDYAAARSGFATKWMGLCSVCRDELGSPKKIKVADDDPPLWTGSRILRREGLYMDILCGLPGCGKEHRVHWQTTRRDGYTGYCPTHKRREIALALQSIATRSSKQRNGIEEKRRRGRRQGEKYIDPQASRASLESAIKALWKQTQSVSSITYLTVAAIFQRNGEQIGHDAVRKRFNECNTGMKWRDFVASVAGENGN